MELMTGKQSACEQWKKQKERQGQNTSIQQPSIVVAR